jgi:ADP-ribose pyrophosphatase
MPPLPEHPDFILESRETVWRGRCQLDIVRFRQRRFDGSLSVQREWELWRRGQGVAMLPYDPASDQVVLIEQLRLPALSAGIDPLMVEVPAGMCEPGEDPEIAVRREAWEETSLAVGHLHLIGNYMLSPGSCDERVALFAGQIEAPPSGPDGVAGHGGVLAEGEDIRVRVWPADRAIAHAVSGGFRNALTAMALLWLATGRDRLRAEWPQREMSHP